MKLAILGTRGIPARYGGFETFAEELSRRLAERGHDVTVYCRSRHEPPSYLGVTLQYLPSVPHKYFETIAHTFFSTLHLLVHRRDVALYCNGANAIFTFLPRLLGMPTAINVDGLERKRKKWNKLAKAWYLASEWLSTVCATEVISDAAQIAEYYRERYGAETKFIPYGAPVGKVETCDVLRTLQLEAGQYFLYVSRLEPENNALLVREAYESTDARLPLALIGDAPYADDYIRQVRNTTDQRVRLPGAIYGQGYHELQSHSFAYIHATEVGGTHPALIEAMGRGALVLYLDTPENAEVAGSAGIPFSAGELAAKIQLTLQMSEEQRDAYRMQAMQRVRERYSWDAVTDEYERLLERLSSRKRAKKQLSANS